MDQAFIAAVSKIILQLWLERELARWQSVGLGDVWLKTLPER